MELRPPVGRQMRIIGCMRRCSRGHLRGHIIYNVRNYSVRENNDQLRKNQKRGQTKGHLIRQREVAFEIIKVNGQESVRSA
jgi:hypothetical protein